MNLEDEFCEYIATKASGLTIREIQDYFKISAKTAKDYVSRFCKPHVYKGSGMAYILDLSTQSSVSIAKAEQAKIKDLETTRKYILEWLEEGNVDIEAWASDPLKRPPQFFIRGEDDDT